MDDMDLKPLRDRVVIKPEDRQEKTKGGVYLPDTASKDRPTEGEVVAVGTGRVLNSGQKVALEVKAGDKVLFSEYSGTEVKISGEKYLIVKQEDILAIR
jgi:chaperonin GroES